MHASRPFREMIARRKIGRNERGAFAVGKFALFSRPDDRGPERPLQLGDLRLLLAGVDVELEPRARVHPRLVDVRVDGDVRAAAHEAAPRVGREAERVVDHVAPLGRAPLDGQVAPPVEVLQDVQRRPVPGLVHRLDAQNRRVVRVAVRDPAQDVEREVQIRVVDGVVQARVLVPVSHPGRAPPRPVLERDRVGAEIAHRRRPREAHGLAAVVEAVLRPPDRVDVQEHAEVVPVRHVEHGVDALQAALEARLVGPVGRELVVAHGQAQRVDARRREARDDVVGDPVVPVAPELRVRLVAAEDLAEAVRVHRRRGALAAEELVEEARRDPGLEHEEGPEVHAHELLVPGVEVRVARAGLRVVQRREAVVLEGRRGGEEEQEFRHAAAPRV